MSMRKNKAILLWSQMTFGGLVLFPLSLSHIDFRAPFATGLAVTAHRSSPAYAALEDIREDYKEEEFIDHRKPTLKGDERQRFRLNDNIPRVRQITLAGLKLRAPQESETQPSQSQSIYIASNTLERDNVQPVSVSNPRTLAPVQHEIDLEDWPATSVGEVAERLVKRELASIGRTASESLSLPSPLKPEPNDRERFGYVSTIAPLGVDNEHQRPLWLNGQIEMTGGLAYVGPETQVVLSRVYEGSTFERGRIWITEGKFEIHVKKALGYLVAELQTRDGRVIGRGEMNLLHVREISNTDNRVQDLRIALRPVTDVAAMRAISGYSHGQQVMPVAGAQIEIEGYTEPQVVSDEGFVTEPTLAAESSFVARASAKDHWASLALGQAQVAQDIRLFKKPLVEALINLTRAGTDRKEAYKSGIVWGQLTQDGRPLKGAEVEMAGHYQPIYFNDMYLPDPKMTTTSSNGLFAFVQVKPGIQALRARSKGRVFPAQVFPTEDKHVAYLNLEAREHVVSQFRVFDAFKANQPVSARVRLVGSEDMLDLNGEGFVDYALLANPFMVEADAGMEYEISRATLTGSPHHVYIPLIRREWLRELSISQQISQVPERGTIVGFIDDQDFEVEMTGHGPQDSMRVVYFDHEGKVVRHGKGVAGGGFAIFNAPLGMQTVFVHPTQARESFSQVVVAEPEYVNVIGWSPTRRPRR